MEPSCKLLLAGSEPLAICRFGPIATPVFISADLGPAGCAGRKPSALLETWRLRGVDPKRDLPAIVDDYCKDQVQQ